MDTNKDCNDCYRCKDCINCIDCDQSDNCNNCKDCINCHNCTDCKGCIHLNGVTGYIDMKPPNETEVQVKQTKDKLYSLNDLHKAAGLEGQVRDLTRHLSEKQICRFDIVEINGGNHRGTYANEKGVYWFAAKVSEDFEDALYEAFSLLVHGNTEKALDIAASFGVTEETK